jgi:hypothetical protein
VCIGSKRIDKNESFRERVRGMIRFRTYGVLLLLDLNDGAVLESPLDNVGLLRGALDVLGAAEGRPELGEVLNLDQVPDVGERGADDGRHFGVCVGGVWGDWVLCCWYWGKKVLEWCFCVAVASCYFCESLKLSTAGSACRGVLEARPI